MIIDIISVEPGLFDGPFSKSIVGKAQKNGIAKINIINLHDYGKGKYKQVDDAPFGGGAGMVLMPEPLSNAIEDLLKQYKYNDIIFFLPEGEVINQKIINNYSLSQRLLIICGHYKGIDQRVVDKYATKIISLGDFVVTGGEIAAIVFCDALIRIIPGAIGNEMSALEDSFQDNFLSPPVYTRPADFNGLQVPKVLLSGNHAKIEDWKLNQSISKTKLLRPDLLEAKNKNKGA